MKSKQEKPEQTKRKNVKDDDDKVEKEVENSKKTNKMKEEEVFQVEGVDVITSTKMEAKVLLIVTSEDNSKPDDKIENKDEHDLSNKMLSSFFTSKRLLLLKMLKKSIAIELRKVNSLEKENTKEMQKE